MLGKAVIINDLYFLETHAYEYSQQIVTRPNTTLKEKCSQGNHINPKQLWHLRLGHIDKSRLMKLAH